MSYISPLCTADSIRGLGQAPQAPQHASAAHEGHTFFCYSVQGVYCIHTHTHKCCTHIYFTQCGMAMLQVRFAVIIQGGHAYTHTHARTHTHTHMLHLLWGGRAAGGNHGVQGGAAPAISPFLHDPPPSLYPLQRHPRPLAGSPSLPTQHPLVLCHCLPALPHTLRHQAGGGQRCVLCPTSFRGTAGPCVHLCVCVSVFVCVSVCLYECVR